MRLKRARRGFGLGQRCLESGRLGPETSHERGRMMLRAAEGGVTLAVRALPGAKRKTAILGVYCEGEKERLKIAVQAPAVEGRANSALIEFLADQFGVAKGRVELVSGELSRSKVFLIKGVGLGTAEGLVKGWVS